jgi:TonB family protein
LGGLLLLGALSCNAIPGNAEQAQQLPWEKTLQQAEVKWLLGDSTGAASLYETLISGMGELPLESQLAILKDAQTFYERQKDYIKVQSLLEKSLAIQSVVSDHSRLEIAALAAELGHNHIRLKAYDKALDCLILAIKIVKEQEGTGSDKLLPYYDRLAEIYRFQQKPALADETLKIKNKLEERLAPCEKLPEDHFTKFIEQMQTKIRATWRPPTSTVNTRVILRYIVTANGHIERIKVTQSCPVKGMDDSAISAVKHVSPLTPMPMMCQDFVHTEFVFDYEIKKKKNDSPVR